MNLTIALLVQTELTSKEQIMYPILNMDDNNKVVESFDDLEEARKFVRICNLNGCNYTVRVDVLPHSQEVK